MQREADAPEKGLTFVKLVAFRFGEEAEPHHFIQRGGAEVAPRHPLQRMDIAQAAWAAFDVGLKIIAGAVIALMARLLLFDFGGVKGRRRPEAVAEDILLHLQKQGDVAGQHARLDKVGGDGQVG